MQGGVGWREAVEVGEDPAAAGGVEEVVDGVEEEDHEAQDGEHCVRVYRVPAQQEAGVNFRLHPRIPRLFHC